MEHVHKWVSYKDRKTGIIREECACGAVRPYTKSINKPPFDRMIHPNQSLNK